MTGTAIVQCTACKATRIVPMEKYAVGDVLQPFPGGGSYGRCLKCKRAGLKVIEIPGIDVVKPVGWHKVPEA